MDDRSRSLRGPRRAFRPIPRFARELVGPDAVTKLVVRSPNVVHEPRPPGRPPEHHARTLTARSLSVKFIRSYPGYVTQPPTARAPRRDPRLAGRRGCVFDARLRRRVRNGAVAEAMRSRRAGGMGRSWGLRSWGFAAAGSASSSGRFLRPCMACCGVIVGGRGFAGEPTGSSKPEGARVVVRDGGTPRMRREAPGARTTRRSRTPEREKATLLWGARPSRAARSCADASASPRSIGTGHCYHQYRRDHQPT